MTKAKKLDTELPETDPLELEDTAETLEAGGEFIDELEEGEDA